MKNSIEGVLAALVADKKKLRCKSWESYQYIWYWNKVVLDESGGLFDLALWLFMTKPNDWEIYHDGGFIPKKV